MKMTPATIARICHEANRAYCQTHGDLSVHKWDDVSEEQRQSMTKGVQYRLACPQSTPEQQHEAWMSNKKKQGWIHGIVKDPDAKTHPNLVPYAELPEHQKAKDALFIGIVEAFRPYVA